MADLLTIGEVSQRSGVASSALRFYEDRGLIQSERAGSGHRRYPRSALRRVAFIVFAQKNGMSLEEAGKELNRLPARRVPEGERRDVGGQLPQEFLRLGGRRLGAPGRGRARRAGRGPGPERRRSAHQRLPPRRIGVTGGAPGVGRAVNATVVASAAGIFVLDYFVSFILG